MQVPAPQGYLYYSAVSKPNLGGPSNSLLVNLRLIREGGHEQLISNGERFKPAFAERDKKQAMIDLRGIPTNWFKIPPQGFLATAQTTICDRPRGLVNGFGLNFASH